MVRSLLSLTRCPHISRIVTRANCFHQLNRHITSWNLARLPHRQLLHVTGVNSQDLLQGLITNDIRHLDDARCIYAFFLNHLGRIICDTLIHKLDTNNLLLEVDDTLLTPVTSHLLKHKLRKDVTITPCSQGQVFSLFTPLQCDTIAPVAQIKEVSNASNLVISNDSRLSLPLARVIVTHACSIDNVISQVQSFTGESDINSVDPVEYEAYRLTNGLSEGPEDHPRDASFPLECNGDTLNAISFFKGCYIGQELTARTYHTGVVRKRIMPLTITGGNWSPGMKLSSTDIKVTRAVGKVRSVCREKNVALALVYVSMVRDTPTVVNELGDEGRILVPSWWPKDKQC